MARRYAYAASLSWGGDEPTAELEVEVEYSVAWGSPETGRGYMADPEKYDPGSPDIVEDIKVLKIDGRERPWALGFGFISDAEAETMITEKLEAHEEDMIRDAAEVEAADADEARERRWEETRNDRLDE